MTQYITIDGLSGVGKTTQAHEVAKRLGWAVRETDPMSFFTSSMWQLMFDDPHEKTMSYFLQYLSMLRASIDYAEQDFIFCGIFFRCMWNFLSAQHGN